MIYRVTLEIGYRECYFDFANPETATGFMLSAATAYNKQASDDLVIVLEAYTMDDYNKKEEEKEAE